MSQPARRPYQPRRRGFDDDQPSAPDINWGALNGGNRSGGSPAAFGPTLSATVKWFNSEKGFGFVAMGDGSGDAFLHCAVLQRAGHDSVGEGASLEVRVGPGQKGLQVTEVVSVDQSTAAPARSSRPPSGPRQDRGPVRPHGRDDRHGQVVQPDQGFRLHSAAGWRQGHLRPHVGAWQPAHAERGPGGPRVGPPGRQGT